MVVALTVTFTVSDAQQIGLSSSYDALLSNPTLAAFQMKRPEQKAPPAFSPWQATMEPQYNRKQLSGTPRSIHDSNYFQYALVLPTHWQSTLCVRLNSCESPRAPPPMDPPTFC